MDKKITLRFNSVNCRIGSLRLCFFTAGILFMQTAFAQQLGAGVGFSLSLCADSTVKAWGQNGNGGLGNGSTSNSFAQVSVSGLNHIVAIATESNHSLALKDDSTVWAWGYNQFGQLGDGSTVTSGCYCKTTAVQVSGLSGVTAIATGSHHSLALKSDGTVWAWGGNTYAGQLGDGTNVDKTTPVQVSGLTGIVAITAGDFHSLAIKNDGTLWAWGSNSYGELGVSGGNRNAPVQVTGVSGVIGISAGQSHSVILKDDGTVWSWGFNYFGQVGNGASGSFTANPTITQVSGLTNIVRVAAGFNNSFAMKNDGTVWSWGGNYNGQLGDGTTTQRTAPVQVTGLMDVTQLVGKNHALALKNDGSLWVWGSNDYGELGDGTTAYKYTATQANGLCVMAAGIGESLAKTGIVVYPNPGNGMFTVAVDDAASPEHTIEIYNITGKKIYSLSFSSEKVEIDLSQQAKGIYFYRLNNSNKDQLTGKIIIQ